MDVNAQDNDGNAALMYVSVVGHKDVARLLIKAGADIHAQDNEGNTALMLTLKNGHTEIVMLLEETDAK